MINKIYNLPSGLRLVHRKMDGVRSVALGVMVGVGSANEDNSNNGISHFIEHVLFKGTARRNAFDISCEIDGLGAQINAFTSKQTTCYYTLSVDEYLENCMDVLSDITLNSTFPEDELEREKGVVIEEIAMSEDDPADLCLENLGSVFFEGHPLGNTILGQPTDIKRINKGQILKYMSDNYCADNTVICMVGNIDFDKALKLTEKYFEGKILGKRESKWLDLPHVTTSKNIIKIKEVEQANIALAFPSIPYGHKQELALLLVNSIFGSGMSSRLYQDIRERQGLAYSVFSYPSTYSQNAFFSIYLGTNIASGAKAVESVKREIAKFKAEGMTDEEFERGKRQLKGSYTLSQESTSSLMRLYARCALFLNKPFDFNVRINEIDNISKDDVKEVIDTIFDMDKVSASYVGRKVDYNILDIIKG